MPTSWLLPEAISDVLPAEARRVEALRRRLLDLFRAHGYLLVIPPLIEYLDSLLTGTGRDLDLRTFKLVDQLSGRQLGLRADFTPQTARIDAHILNRSGIVRLCYAGPVVHTRPSHPLATREPIQVGAELYGNPHVRADAEIQRLAVASLRAADAGSIALDLGHTGVVRCLLARAALPSSAAEEVLAALAVKDAGGLAAAIGACPTEVRDALLALTRLHGGVEVLAAARGLLPPWEPIVRALDELEYLHGQTTADRLSIDLADLHGYRYYTGVNFAAYAVGGRDVLARGGRYDDIGRAFGRARPAVGFSLDLRELSPLVPDEAEPAILAPLGERADLLAAIAALRAQGEIVVQGGAGESEVDGLAIDRELRWIDGQWRAVARAG